jgi:hypothetical protein
MKFSLAFAPDEKAILTWVTDREYIPNTLYANVQPDEFIRLAWRLHETTPRDRLACPAGGAGIRSGRTERPGSAI